MRYILILILMISMSAHAVSPIKKGEVSQTDGYVFSVDEEKKVRQINEEKIKLEDLQVHMEEKSVIQDQRIEMYSKYFKDHKDLSPWSTFGWIAVGSAGTIAAIWLATSIVKSVGK